MMDSYSSDMSSQFLQARQRLRCWYTRNMDIDEGSDQTLASLNASAWTFIRSICVYAMGIDISSAPILESAKDSLISHPK